MTTSIADLNARLRSIGQETRGTLNKLRSRTPERKRVPPPPRGPPPPPPEAQEPASPGWVGVLSSRGNPTEGATAVYEIDALDRHLASRP